MVYCSSIQNCQVESKRILQKCDAFLKQIFGTNQKHSKLSDPEPETKINDDFFEYIPTTYVDNREYFYNEYTDSVYIIDFNNDEVIQASYKICRYESSGNNIMKFFKYNLQSRSYTTIRDFQVSFEILSELQLYFTTLATIANSGRYI